MFLSDIKNKVGRTVGILATATMIALPGSYAVVPSPRTEAFDVWGAVIGGAISYAQLDSEINTYNKSEKGRQALFEHLKQRYGVNSDPELNAYIDRIMRNLTNAIATVDPSINEMPYNYFINNEQSFNAFCTLGHNLTINTGLFGVLNREDEIAVVLAHEMGHGQKNHPANGARNSLGVSILASSAGGGILAAIAANALTNQGITKPMEREADSLAFEYLTHSPYNPGACGAVWQRVIDKSGNNPDNFLTFLAGGSDHPSHASRRDSYAKKIYKYSGERVEVKDGNVKINGQHFMTPAPYGDMSGAERSFLVAGNLARAFQNGQNGENAWASGNTIMLGNQEIATVVDGDEAAEVLVGRLNGIK